MSSKFIMKLSKIGQLVVGCQHVLASSLAASLVMSGIGSSHFMNAAAEIPAANLPTSTQALPDGVYLYGQSTQPDELGKGYFVFEAKRGKVVGALYMPSSSFDCASGQFEPRQLALTVVNSYDRTTNPFAIALEQNYNVAAGDKLGKPVIGLDGFQQLKVVSQNDLRMLEVCKADLISQTQK